MFGFGFSEILLIFGLALVVLGPDKLPQVARTIGRWAGRARAMAREFRDQLETEADSLNTGLQRPPGAPQPAAPAAAAAPQPASSASAAPQAEPPPDAGAAPQPAAAPDSTSASGAAPHARGE